MAAVWIWVLMAAVFLSKRNEGVSFASMRAARPRGTGFRPSPGIPEFSGYPRASLMASIGLLPNGPAQTASIAAPQIATPNPSSQTGEGMPVRRKRM